MVDAQNALQRLRDGNRRFVEGKPRHRMPLEARRQELAGGQEPFAAILGCADSRVPAEIVFDQGLGDLFVIRVAGNIAQPSQIGSVEFAASVFGTRLVVVLGHSQCGAISATIEQSRSPGGDPSKNLLPIVEFIRPSVATLLDRGLDAETILEEAVRANVRRSVEQIRQASPIIEQLEREDGLVIVGAEYSLESGVVEFFDGVP